MEYWRGIMDWPLDKKWKCSTCNGNYGLEWGFVHTQCRCNNCHTQFTMRADDEDRTVLTNPKCQLKDEYKKPAQIAYAKHHIPLEELTDNQWDEAFAKVGA